jgi:hypothetical protein
MTKKARRRKLASKKTTSKKAASKKASSKKAAPKKASTKKAAKKAGKANTRYCYNMTADPAWVIRCEYGPDERCNLNCVRIPAYEVPIG